MPDAELKAISSSDNEQPQQQSVFKYFSADGTLRFAESWYLRLTPPAEFNDPFELLPPVRDIWSDRFLTEALRPQELKGELANAIKGEFLQRAVQFSDQDALVVAGALLDQVPKAKRRRACHILECRIPGCRGNKAQVIFENLKRSIPAMLKAIQEKVQTIRPTIDAAARAALTQTARSRLGVVCLSLSSNQPLMWAHYASMHQGAVVEFDASHPTFNRRRTDNDDLGYLRPVVYSATRSVVDWDCVADGSLFSAFALTKSHEWSYEEELRLLWPLDQADAEEMKNGTKFALLATPSDAVRSITFGCRASDDWIRTVMDTARRTVECDSVQFRRAVMDDERFFLHYADL